MENSDWLTLVERTRLLVRAIGLEQFDASYSQPGAFCELDDYESISGQLEPSDPAQPLVFRHYLRTAVAFLEPLRPSTARAIVDGLNACIAEPVSRLQLEEGDLQFDLLTPEPYAAIDVVRYTLISILHQLGWGPEPGPESGNSPEDEPLVDDLLAHLDELDVDPADNVSYGLDEDEPDPAA